MKVLRKILAASPSRHPTVHPTDPISFDLFYCTTFAMYKLAASFQAEPVALLSYYDYTLLLRLLNTRLRSERKCGMVARAATGMIGFSPVCLGLY